MRGKVYMKNFTLQIFECYFLWEKSPQISLGLKEKKIYYKFSIKRTLTITPNQNWSDFICFPFKFTFISSS